MKGLFAFAAIVLACSAVSASPITREQIHVIDADTIRINHSAPDIRLVGCNAPETYRALCDSERRLGIKATERLREIVNSNTKLDLEIARCACKPGTEGSRLCNYGRRCGVLKANGRDVCSILIAEKFAVAFVCGETSCPPTPSPWCE